MQFVTSLADYQGKITFWKETDYIELWNPYKSDIAQPREKVFFGIDKPFNDSIGLTESIQSNGMGLFIFNEFILITEKPYSTVYVNDNITLNEQTSKNIPTNENVLPNESLVINAPFTQSNGDTSKPLESFSITNS